MLAALLTVLLSASNVAAAGITLVTHGYQVLPEPPEWVEFMVSAIGSENIDGTWTRYTLVIDDPGGGALRATAVRSDTAPTASSSGEILIELDWSQVAGGFLGIPDYSTADIAEKVTQCLLL